MARPYTYETLQGKAKGAPSGVKTLLSAWNSVGTHKVRLGTPTAYPRTSAWNSGLQDHFYKMLKYMFLVSLQWNSGSTQGPYIK